LHEEDKRHHEAAALVHTKKGGDVGQQNLHGNPEEASTTGGGLSPTRTRRITVTIQTGAHDPLNTSTNPDS
jgi:hypothetical protein